MKDFFEKSEIGERIDQSTKLAYTCNTRDFFDVAESEKRDPLRMFNTAYYAGFYAGISCAINRGYDKRNDPRKAV